MARVLIFGQCTLGNEKLSVSREAFELLRQGLLDIQVSNVAASAFPDLLSFLDLLYDWNENVNLTSITGLEGIATHLIDSLSVARFASFKGTETLVDIGSGAGLPGIPLALAFPDLKVTLVESISKKVTFQQHAVKKLGLTNVTPLQGRAEVVAREKHLSRNFDVVVARAVGSIDQLCKWAKPFLKPHGSLIAYKGKTEMVDATPPDWQVLEQDQFLLGQKNRTLMRLQPR